MINAGKDKDMDNLLYGLGLNFLVVFLSCSATKLGSQIGWDFPLCHAQHFYHTSQTYL